MFFRLFLTCKIDPKMDAKYYLEGAWGDLRGLPEASRRPSGLVFGRNSPWMRKMIDFLTFPGRPGTPLGTLGEPKNSLKIDFLLKNGVPNVLFRRFLCTKLVSTLFAWFSVDFSRKIDEKSMKKTMCFFRIVACFFQHGDPHETMYFTKRKLLFHFSRFCVFFQKNIEKSAPKSRPRFFPQKSPKSRSRGSVLGPKTVPN